MKPKTVKRWLVLAAISLATGCASIPKEPPEPALPTSAQAGDTTVVAVAASGPCCKMTLPEFLGLTALGKLVCGGLDRLRNRLGMLFPGLEAKPAVLALTDPANMDPNAPPAVQAAAGVKAEKDAAAQKVKAIRYLATIGCSTCYPDVEKGLLEATKDCTEEVRYEAVKALREAAGNPCNTCRENSCCTVAVMQRLYQIAFEGDEQGCPLEPSGRVRRVARLALNRCGCPVAGGTGAMVAPDEGPMAEPVPEDVPPPEPTPDAMAAVSRLPWRAGLAASNAPQRMPAAQADPSFVQPAGFSPVVARVNGQPIALDEVLSRVDRRIATDHPQATLEDREHLRQTLLREELQRAIDTRLLCDEARQNLPPQEIARVAYDPRNGASPDGVLSPPAAEALADDWLRRSTRMDTNCDRRALYGYYRTNLERYRQPPQLCWEQVAVRLDRVSSREEAWELLAQLRSEMLGDAAPVRSGMKLDAVQAREFPWTSLSNLPSGPVGAELVTLPEGTLSKVIEDADALYLVRVLDRRDASVLALDQILETVRADLLQERYDHEVQQHLAWLRGQAETWTIYDADPARAAGASPAVRRIDTGWNDAAAFARPLSRDPSGNVRGPADQRPVCLPAVTASSHMDPSLAVPVERAAIDAASAPQRPRYQAVEGAPWSGPAADS